MEIKLTGFGDLSISVTGFGDLSISALSETGFSWVLRIRDNPTGESCVIRITWEQLSAVLQILLDPSGEPDNEDALRKIIGSIFDELPQHLRPIP